MQRLRVLVVLFLIHIFEFLRLTVQSSGAQRLLAFVASMFMILACRFASCIQFPSPFKISIVTCCVLHVERCFIRHLDE